MSPDDEVVFVADGRRIKTPRGRSIAGALYSHGDRTLSRSLKFHRPRGYACGTGDCNNCMMRVDGVPNVKTCMTPAKNGMVVTGQNAWPNVRRDVFRGADLTFRHDLDHHRWFVRPRFLYGLFGKVIRAFAGWGRLPAVPSAETKTETLRPDVLVLGAGPAGLAAAEAAAEAGAQVLLLEHRDRLGGHAANMDRDLPDPDVDDTAAVADGSGESNDVTTYRAKHLVERWTKAVRDADTVDVRTETAVAAVYRSGIVVAHGPHETILARPRSLVVANGGTSGQALFTDNDRPGVMDAVAVQTLLHKERVRPGERAIVYGAGAHGLHVAKDLHAAGVDVAAIVTPHPSPHGPAAYLQDIERARIPIITNARVRAVHGFGRVKAATIATGAKGDQRITTDLVVLAMGRKTVPDVFQALGCGTVFDDAAGGVVPVLDRNLQTTFPGVFAAGDTSGMGSLATARASGRLAGLSAAVHAGRPLRGAMVERERLRKRLATLNETHGGPARIEHATLTQRAAGVIGKVREVAANAKTSTASKGASP